MDRKRILFVMLMLTGLLVAPAIYAAGGDSGGTVSRSTEYMEKFDKKLADSGQFRTALIIGAIAMLIIIFVTVKRNPRLGAKMGCILVGCLFFFLSAREKVYFEKGKAATATIIDVKISTNLHTGYDDEGDPEYKSETSAVKTFTYTVDGKEYSGKTESSTSHILHPKKGRMPQASTDEKFAAKERAKKGTTFTLHYMPDKPSDYTLAGEKTPKIYFLIGCVLVVVGLFVIRKKKASLMPLFILGAMAKNTTRKQQGVYGGHPYQPQQPQRFGQSQQFGQTQFGQPIQGSQNGAEIQKKFCTQCGNQIETGAKFCPSCGTQL